MGLLGNGFDDPQSSANMALAAGLLRGDFGGGLLGANAAYQDTKQSALRQRLGDMQMQEHAVRLQQLQKAQAQAEALRGLQSKFFNAGTPSAGGMIDGMLPSHLQTGAVPVPAQPPKFDVNGFTSAALSQGLMDPMSALQLQAAAQKDDAPIKLGQGEALFDRKTLKPIANNPKAEDLPSAVREYNFARQQGYPGTFQQFQIEQKRAGATNVSVNTGKTFLSDIAGGLGKSIVDARTNAQGALGTIGTVNRLMDALDTGKVMAGPGTTFRQFGLQVGNTLGVSGKDASEKMLNTRQAIQSLAQLELDAAQQMKGQGQITEAERSIIRRAASGDVDSMTAQELRLLGGVLDRTARTKITGYNSQIKPLQSNPDAAALAPFLAVEEPPARAAAGGVRRYNPATGRIE